MNVEDPIRKCDKCNESKPRSLFYKHQYCKRCHIKDHISHHILKARVANRLNLSIDEINNILENDSERPHKEWYRRTRKIRRSNVIDDRS